MPTDLSSIVVETLEAPLPVGTVLSSLVVETLEAPLPVGTVLYSVVVETLEAPLPVGTVLSSVYAETLEQPLLPIAVVPNISGTVGSPATFDGSGSILANSYAWTITSVPGGSSVSVPTPFPDGGAATPIDMTDNEGLWHFEGNANDTSGNSRTGTVSGATLTTGKVGSQAYQFVQTDSTDVIVFGTTGFDFVSADAFSFALWVKPDASQPDANAIVISKSNLTSTGYAIIQNGGANSNQYTFIVGTGAGLSGIGSNFTLTAGYWNHVAVTRAANGTSTKVYVNGAQVADVNFLTTIASSDPVALGIGNLGPAPGTPGVVFNGVIDELAIWSRELTPLEVETVYDYGNGTYAGFGETLTFTPDVTGTYTVQAEANSFWGSDSVTADAVIAAASGVTRFELGGNLVLRQLGGHLVV